MSEILHESVALTESSIHDNSPTVVMDIRLGKRFSYIDFDYEAFDVLARRIALDPEITSDLTIRIGKKPHVVNGSYSPSQNNLKVGMRPKVNETLTHELQHAKDTSHGMKQGARGALGTLGILGVFMSPVQAAIVVGLVSSNHESAAGNVADLNLMLSSAAILMWHYGYNKHPLEVTANAASMILTESVINSIKK